MPINIGRGKYLYVEEGQLSYVPPPKRVGPFNKAPRKSAPGHTIGTGRLAAELESECPGLSDFKSRAARERTNTCPRDKFGRPKGLPDGMTKGEMIELKKSVRSILGVPDIEAIKVRLDQEEDPIVRMIMADHVATILEGHCEREKQTAKRELMVYLKAKPVVRQEVTVSEAEVAWKEDIDFVEAGKDSWQDNLN